MSRVVVRGNPLLVGMLSTILVDSMGCVISLWYTRGMCKGRRAGTFLFSGEGCGEWSTLTFEKC